MMYILLKFVSLFRWLYNLMGVNFDQLTSIVATKMIMDNRRNTIRFNQQQSKDTSQSFLLVLFLYGIFGLFFGYLIYVTPSFLIALTIYHSYIIVIVSLTLVSDFSSVLLDTSDNTIILPRPVSSITLLAARITHIILYIGQIVLGLSLGSVVVTFIKFGVGIGLLVILTTILSVFFAAILTNGLYLVLMHFTSEEKLKTIINYFQIVMAMLMMGAYQILPRLMTNDLLTDTTFGLSLWGAFVPPLWMSGLVDAFYSHNFDLIHIVCSTLAFMFSIGAFFILSKYFSSTFSEKLADLGTNSAVNESAVSTNKVNKKASLNFGSLLTRAGVERASYDLTTKALARDRKLKLKIYPGIGYILILGLVFLLRQNESLQTTLENLPNRSIHIFIIYSAFLVVQTVMAQIAISDDFKAGWVYSSAPITQPGLILTGAWKAILTTFFAPIYLVFVVLILSIWKLKGIDDLIFGFVGNLLISLIAANISAKHFPLSMEPNAKNQAGNFIKVLIIMISVGLFGAGHYILSRTTYGLFIGLPIAVGLTMFLYNQYKNTRWSKIEY